MKTSTIEVGELVSTLSAAGVNRQLSTLPGVHHADVNYVAGSATVHYDELRVTLEAIQQRVVDCGYHCRGELVPAHVCDPADHKTIGDAHAAAAKEPTKPVKISMPATAITAPMEGQAVRRMTRRPT